MNVGTYLGQRFPGTTEGVVLDPIQRPDCSLTEGQNRNLAALLLQLSGDFSGALRQLEGGPVGGLGELLMARSMVMIGREDEGRDLLRSLVRRRATMALSGRKTPYSIGTQPELEIAGPRFDLEVLGLSALDLESFAQVSSPVARDASTWSMLSLGEFAALRAARSHWTWTSRENIERLCSEVEALDTLVAVPPKMSWESAASHLQGVRGWFSPDEGSTVANLAAQVKQDYSIVEIGSFAGRSTTCLVLGARRGNRPQVISIDPHLGPYGAHDADIERLLQENLQKVSDSGAVRTQHTTSAEAARDWGGPPVGLLLIDADHALKSVMTDYTSWKPHLAEGAIVAFHDSELPGPNAALREILQSDPDLRVAGLRDTLCVGIHNKESGPRPPQDAWLRYLEYVGKGYHQWHSRFRERSLALDLCELY